MKRRSALRGIAGALLVVAFVLLALGAIEARGAHAEAPGRRGSEPVRVPAQPNPTPESAPAAKRRLLEVVAPERVPSGREVAILLRGDAIDPATATLKIDGASQPVSFHRRGSDEIEATLGPLAPGPHHLLASIAGEAPVRAALEAEAPPVAFVAGAAQALVADALAVQGFARRPWSSGALPDDAALVVVTGSGFDATEAARAVRSGAGLLIVGRDAAEHAAAGALASSLPARVKRREPRASTGQPGDAGGQPRPSPSEPPPPAEPPKGAPPAPTEVESATVAVALVIDRSGSMAGEKMRLAKQSAIATAEVLAPDDLLAVVAFNEAPTLVMPLGVVGAPETVRNRVASLAVGGGTRFFEALEMAADQLRRAKAAIRHVVLLTDGDAQDRFIRPFPTFVGQTLVSAGISLSTVYIAGDEAGTSDPEFTGLLAQWGRGRTYPATASEIPAIVTAEVRRVAGLPAGGSRRGGKTSEPPKTPPRPAPTPPPPQPKPPDEDVEVVAVPSCAAVEGLDLAGLPRVRVDVALDPRPGAAIALRGAGSDGPPLAALRAAGKGSVALLALDEGALARWSGDPRLQRLLAGLASAVARVREAGAAGAPFEVRIDGEALVRGDDRLGLLPEATTAPRERLRSGIDRVSLPASLSGSTRVLPDGRRVSSLRDDPSALASRLVVAPAAPAREKPAPTASRPSDPGAPPPSPPLRAVACWIGAAVAIALAALAFRLAD
ncbi:MAG TPA: vWA domain-containing protein [Planctomycetota bacterium]|nr:vWA domain-containing protein [Planctomycetota bacterium]